MPRFSANLTMLFTEHALPDRIDAAAVAGFKAVEYAVPYDFPAEVLAKRLAANGLTQALFNMPAGDWHGGERGIAIFPDRVEEFRKSVDTALAYAKVLNCTRVNCLSGLAKPDADPKAMEDTLVANLQYAAPRFAEAGVKLLVEAINTVDMPGFFLNNSRQAMALLDRVGSDNLYFQYDFYHMQVMEGDLARTLERLLPRVAHVQIADNPGRNEPGTGEINYPFIFAHLDRIGYDGWVGAEYKPKGRTEDGLGWMTAMV